MLKLKDVPQEQMGDVVRIASEMYDREHAEKQERKATVAAAEEVGIPQEYLERAAQELQAQRIAQARIQQAKRRNVGIAAGVAAVAIGAFAFLNRPAPPALLLNPTTVQAQLGSNSGTQATVTAQGNAYVLHVDRFQPEQNGDYFANLNVPLSNTSVSGYRDMQFKLHSDGGLPKVRIFFEGTSANQRWKSPDVAITQPDQNVSISLNQFVRQEKNASGVWKDLGNGAPSQASRISFKVGEKINPVNVSGEIAISDIQLK